MIPKNERFNMREHFLTFKNNARKYATQHFVIYKKEALERKLAVVVPKKLNTKAVVRNALRRALKQELLDNVKTHEIVVIAKPKAAQKQEVRERQEELDRWLKQHV